MRFALSAEQRQFAGTVHDLLKSADATAAARSWADGDRAPGLELWRRLGALGVTALSVPERWGGLGAGPADLVVACEELGHHAVPGPVAESVAAVPVLLSGPAGTRPADAGPADAELADAELADAELADAELADLWLPRLARGEALATLAMPPHLPYAADADAADLVLLAEGGTVRLAGAERVHRSLDATRRLAEVTGEGAAVRGAAGPAFDTGVLASAAQLLGAGRALLERSVEYAGQRVQFGRPIGGFQAVQHQLADVLVGLELARPLLYGAAVTLAAGSPDAPRDVSAAKVACADAAHRAARTALQVHGAIGYTRESDLWLWLTKVRALVPAWGSQSVHRARVMAALA